MGVQTGRRTTPSGRLDAVDRAGFRARGVIEQHLGKTLVRTGSVNRREVNSPHVIHMILRILSFMNVRFCAYRVPGRPSFRGKASP